MRPNTRCNQSQSVNNSQWPKTFSQKAASPKTCVTPQQASPFQSLTFTMTCCPVLLRHLLFTQSNALQWRERPLKLPLTLGGSGPPPNTVRVILVPTHPQTKLHLNQFSQFCVVYSCVQQTDTHTHAYTNRLQNVSSNKPQQCTRSVHAMRLIINLQPFNGLFSRKPG